MYKEHGLMVRLTNPQVLEYLRENHDKTNLELVENALRNKLGIPPKSYRRKQGSRKNIDCLNPTPVKVCDPDLIDHVTNQRHRYGISHRFTVEQAILNVMRSK